MFHFLLLHGNITEISHHAESALSSRIMPFFPPSSQHGEAAAAPCLCRLSGWSTTKTVPLYFLGQGASLSVTADVFTESGPKGDPLCACGWSQTLPSSKY